MTETIHYVIPALDQLMPLILEFKNQRQEGVDVDLRDMAVRAGGAFGVDDIDAYALQRFGDIIREGVGLAFDDEASELIADIFTQASVPVMTTLVSFAKGDITANGVVSSLADVCLQNNVNLCNALQGPLGIPDELAELLGQKLGLHLVALYCFAAAYKIYQQAAQDAAIARAYRIEVEQRVQEAIAHLKEERVQLQEFFDGYMLDRLVPVREGIANMDQAVIDGDEDGFIAANAELWELFGRGSQYQSAHEFEELMMSDDDFVL